MNDEIKGKRGRKPGGQKANKGGRYTININSKEVYEKIIALARFSNLTMADFATKAIEEYAAKYNDNIIEMYHEHLAKEKELKEKYMKEVIIPIKIDNPYKDNK